MNCFDKWQRQVEVAFGGDLASPQAQPIWSDPYTVGTDVDLWEETLRCLTRVGLAKYFMLPQPRMCNILHILGRHCGMSPAKVHHIRMFAYCFFHSVRQGI